MLKIFIIWAILMATIMFVPTALKADNMKMGWDVKSQQWTSLCFKEGKKNTIEICKTHEEVTGRVKTVESQSTIIFVVKEKQCYKGL